MITSTGVTAGTLDNKTVLHITSLSFSIKNVPNAIQSKSECQWVENNHKQVPNIVNRNKKHLQNQVLGKIS